jgi:hypothetical protein
MNCEEARLYIGADPDDASPELLEHLEKCPECQAYRREMQYFNTKIRRAFAMKVPEKHRFALPGGYNTPAAAVATDPTAHALPPDRAADDAGPVATAASTASATPTASAGPTASVAPVASAGPADPAASNVTILPRRRSEPPVVPKQRRPRLMAFAASVIGASLVALTLWLSRPPESLAAELVKHVEGEPNSWSKTEPVTRERLIAVLRKTNVRLGPGAPSIVYANSCWFRGHFVPHLVVTTADGPVTVLILMNEVVSAAREFNEEGFSGLLVPASTGSVAVLSRTPMPLAQPAGAMVKALNAAEQPASVPATTDGAAHD